MSKQTKYNSKKPSLLKQLVVVIGLFVFLFGGMFATIVAVDNFKNYNSPYFFAFTCSTLGLVIGLIVARKIKPYIILNPKMLTNYSNLTIMFSIGFIGSFMLVGHYYNSTISNLYKCNTFTVIDKEFHKGGVKRPEKNILILNVEGTSIRLLCTKAYWQTISVGQTANACIYKSPLGFDYLTLPEDK
ncbi:MAG: hypothetical protein IPF81_04105 [Bacteroidetes bacterium]|nr:hypothetical protein [Bacteroidota bacterium]